MAEVLLTLLGPQTGDGEITLAHAHLFALAGEQLTTDRRNLMPGFRLATADPGEGFTEPDDPYGRLDITPLDEPFLIAPKVWF